MRGLSKSFGGLQALKSVDLSIAAGQILGLVGPNGSGKTTLLNVVTGYVTATEGAVMLHGEDILGARPEAVVRRGVAWTFQEAMTFPDLTVRENVIAGMFLQCQLKWRGAFVYPRAHRREKARLRRDADAVLERVGFGAKPETLAGDLGSESRSIWASRSRSRRLLGYSCSTNRPPAWRMRRSSSCSVF